MSRPQSGWPGDPTPRPSQTTASTPAGHYHQNTGPPPPPRLPYSIGTENRYPSPTSQLPRQPVPHQQPVGGELVYSAASYSHPNPTGLYHGQRQDPNHMPPGNGPPPPSYYRASTSSSDPRPNAAAQGQLQHQSNTYPREHDSRYFQTSRQEQPQGYWHPPTQSGAGTRHADSRFAPSSSSRPEPNPTAGSIPNLIGEAKAQAVDNMRFRLVMRQQPKAARACGSGERDRRNIDPPPIVQLHVEASYLTKEDICKYLRYEGYVMNCWIYDESGTFEVSHMPSEYRYQRRLTGSLVGTPFYGKDERGQEGCFFPFSDLSVRTLGKYRLKFNLIMLDITNPGKNKHFPVLAEVFSEVFDVYTAKEFPGINESSKLVRTLREQGCIISIKKGNDKKKRARDAGDESDDDDDPDDETGSAQGKRRQA